MNRLRREDGAISAEFVGILPLLLLVAVFGWQALMTIGAGNSAASAARNGSRAMSTGEDPEDAVERSVPAWLGERYEDWTVDVPGDRTRVDVTVRVPVLFPGFGLDAFTVTRSADLPATG